MRCDLLHEDVDCRQIFKSKQPHAFKHTFGGGRLGSTHRRPPWQKLHVLSRSVRGYQEATAGLLMLNKLPLQEERPHREAQMRQASQQVAQLRRERAAELEQAATKMHASMLEMEGPLMRREMQAKVCCLATLHFPPRHLLL